MNLKKLESDGMVWVVEDYECESCSSEGYKICVRLCDGHKLDVGYFDSRKEAIEFINSIKKAGILSE